MLNYESAGVNIKEGYKTVNLIKKYAKDTQNKSVLNNLGSFAAMLELGNSYKNPVLVSGTDGVGTKIDIALNMKKYDTVGIDCVAMCVNDILCHGAKPLFFLDYIACGKLDANIAAELVKGVADGCIESGASLVGGETAEMPGVYEEGVYDLAGFSVGVIEKDNIIDGSSIKEGDALIGLESSGVHSNGFSLVRKIVKDYDSDFNGRRIGDVLLTPTKIYVKPILEIMKYFNIKGMAHITGGGFYENIPRMFKDEYGAVINKKSFNILDIFKYIMSFGVSENDMFNTFNMGIGFVLCVDRSDSFKVIKALDDLDIKAYKIGDVVRGGKGVCIE